MGFTDWLLTNQSLRNTVCIGWSYNNAHLLKKSSSNRHKGPVKLIKRVKIALSFLQSVPSYDFKLAYVILQMAVKEFFETHF